MQIFHPVQSVREDQFGPGEANGEKKVGARKADKQPESQPDQPLRSFARMTEQSAGGSGLERDEASPSM